MNTLYYTVEKELTSTGDDNVLVEETTGTKSIIVYEIYNDTPKEWFRLEVMNHQDSQEQIEQYLEDNGFGEREYKFVWL